MYRLVISNSSKYKEEYIRRHGKHFNEKLCRFAIEHMKHERFIPWAKYEVMSLLRTHGVMIDTDHCYDIVYVANMAKADFLGSSIPDEAHLIKYVKDYLEDEDGYESVAFCRFLADCKALNREIDWIEMI